MLPNGKQPQIFLSFAGEDRPVAERLAGDLVAYGVRAFIDAKSIALGQDIVLTINNALEQSDYFVLLWSCNSADRTWVTAEWTAALTRELNELTREINERRSFFFVIRLDHTPMPAILAPRKYLDAFDGWDQVAAKLAGAWNADRAMDLPVLPAPEPLPLPTAVPIVLYVRNQRLAVLHVLGVSGVAAGSELPRLVAAALRLPPEVSATEYGVVARICYELRFVGRPLLDRPLVEQGITDGSTIDLIMSIEVFSGGQVRDRWDLRPAGSACPGAATRSSESVDHLMMELLVDAALDHLRPE